MIFAVLSATGCGHRRDTSPDPGSRAPRIDAVIEVLAHGQDRPVRFTFEQLTAMPSTHLENVTMLKSHEADESTSWEGPTLTTLLADVDLGPGPFAVTLEADDGYQIEAKLREIEDAIIALKDGRGRWLAEVDKRCYLRLVAPRKTANFWVANLRRIRLEPVSE